MSNSRLNNRPTACVITLGCKVNQFESAAIERTLVDAGYTLTAKGGPVDLTVVNTCTVTHKADQESRSLIRRAHRLNSEGRIVVAGCLAQIRPEEMAALPGVALVLGQQNKHEVLAQLALRDDERIRVAPVGRLRSITDLGFPVFDRTRAFFRIQDGCSSGCAYCTVPKARGPSRSLSAALVKEGLRFYHKAGYEEAVLTGIHLGAWGLDLEPPADLTGLLMALAANTGANRIRLSSIEPNEVTPAIVGLVKDGPRFCPHLHLPLQSGSDRILSAMRRPYNGSLFADLVNTAADKRPDLCVGADVLVGFPGEDEPAFEETKSLLEGLPVSYLHVFPFSIRPGVAAAAMPGQVDAREKKRRVGILRALGREKRLDFHTRCLGMIRPTLIENTKDPGTGMPRGLTDNYISVLIRNEKPRVGRIAPVRLLDLSPDGRVIGEVVGEAAAHG